MKKLGNYLSVGILAAIAVACVGEFVLCFVRDYSELWYSVLVPGAIASALAVCAFVLKKHWLNYAALVMWIAVCVLLAGFPAYVMYLGIILGGVALVAEVVLTVTVIKSERTD